MCMQASMSSSSSTENSTSSDEEPASGDPRPGTHECLEQKVYCPCTKCANMKMTKRHLLSTHLQKNGRHIARPLPVRISTDESSGSSSDDSDSEGQKHDTHMDDATPLIKEVGMKSTSTPAEEVLKLSRLAMGFSSDELSSSSDDSDFQDQEDVIHVVDTKPLINDAGVTSTTMPAEEDDNFTRLASMPLFPKSESSTLATLVLLLFLKVLHGWTEASFTDLLRLLADKILPKDNKMPTSHTEVSLAMKGNGHEMDIEALLRLFAHKLTSERDQVFTMMLQMSLTDPNKPAPSMPLMQLVQQHLSTPQHPPTSSDKGKGPISETPKPSTNIWRRIHKLRNELEHIPDTDQRDMLIEVIQGMEEDVRLVEAQLMQSEHATPATDEQVITATPPTESTIGTRATRTFDETPKTPITYEVTTTGKREVTLLLSNDGKVFKDEAGKRFFQYIHNRAEEIFGNYIENDWRKQDNKLKEQIYSDVVAEFGNPGYSYAFIMDIVCRHLHAKRDRLRLQLTKDLGSPRPTWITDMTTWDDLIKDAKFKKDTDKNPNHTPFAQEQGKRRLKDTSKATQARLLRIGSHKLGPCGYSSIQGTLIRQFGKAVSEKDLKYALKHGVQGLRQQMLERGEKFSTSHGTHEVQQSHSNEAVDSGCEEPPEGSAACDKLASARHEPSGKDERQGHNGEDEHVASSCKRETRQNKKKRKNRY